jgi:Dyp-type peroxidase family
MQHLDERDTPLTEEELPILKATFTNLQGHILRSHGRDRSIHIFLRFLPGKSTQAKRWIAQIAPRITSAQKQLDEAKQYDHGKGASGDLFCCFFLSARGYRILDIPNLPTDAAFQHGMAGRQGLTTARTYPSEETSPALNDPPKYQWDREYQQEIHAMLLLAHDDPKELLWAQESLWEKQRLPRDEQWRVFKKLLGLHGVAEICAIEYGRVRRNDLQQSIEHFGYVDGRSQPLFFQKDVSQETHDRGGTDQWNPESGPNLVLVKDPNGDPEGKGIPAYGSYLVFRKLLQDVDGFEHALDDLANVLNLKDHDRKRAEALVMGRFRDGTPLTIECVPKKQHPIPNNFNYINDPQGLKCPFQAHIRKVNPRGERDRVVQSALTATLKKLSVVGQEDYDSVRSAITARYAERCHRIARRSVLYGMRKTEPDQDPSLTPTTEVGVLFMCYQSDIRRQFEFLQASWANNENAPAQGTAPDAIVGRVKVGQQASPQKWPRRWNGLRSDNEPFCFQNFITLKGGEYFFAPSISFLRNIAAFPTSV